MRMTRFSFAKVLEAQQGWGAGAPVLAVRKYLKGA